jgi:hypothetical protein
MLPSKGKVAEMTATIDGMAKAKPTVQMTLRLEPELFEAVQEAARRAGKPVVAWMSEAAREKMQREAASGGGER